MSLSKRVFQVKDGSISANQMELGNVKIRGLCYGPREWVEILITKADARELMAHLENIFPPESSDPLGKLPSE